MPNRIPRIIRADALPRRRFLAGGVAAVALAATVTTGAFAQSAPTATPAANGARSQSAQVQQDQQAFLNAFASKLGVDANTLQNAFKAAEKQVVTTDLAAGRITQDQATQMNQRIDQQTGLPIGHFGGGPEGGPGGRGHGPGGPFGADVATFLGIQQTDLSSALQSGQTLAQVAQAHGKTRDQLKTYLTQQEKTRLDQAVKDGRITQAQEDQRMSDLSTRLDQMIDSTGPGPSGRGGRGGPGGPGGRGPGGPGVAAAPNGANPSATATPRG